MEENMKTARKVISPKTVGLIVIGSEILNGKVKDTNSRLICRTVPLLGLQLRKISVIPDDVRAIADEVCSQMKQYDYVITSGGIGSTHDDVTYEGIAKALNENIVTHSEFFQTLRYLSEPDVVLPSDPITKLAKIPESSELLYGTRVQIGSEKSYPVVKVKNVFILPGVPRLFNLALEIIKDHIRDPCVKFSHHSLYITAEETKIAKCLSELAEKYEGSVSIGSYPAFHNSYYRVRITFDSLDGNTVKLAYEEAKSLFEDCVVEYNPDPISRADYEVYKLSEDKDTSLGNRVSESIKIIEEALDKYSDSELVICFNGGKDCTVLLHLVYAVVCRRNNTTTSDAKSEYNNSTPDKNCMKLPKLLYIRSHSTFPEIEMFVQKTIDLYYLSTSRILRPDLQQCDSHKRGISSLSESRRPTDNAVVIYEGPIKDVLGRFLQDYPNIKGAFMGTRYSDPGTHNMVPMKMSDPGWPQILRINPLLNWTYSEIWNFLRSLSLPYCSLYDNGYTSLGSMEDTHPNPQLRYITETGRIAYHPAYKLEEENCERVGRVKENKNNGIIKINLV